MLQNNLLTSKQVGNFIYLLASILLFLLCIYMLTQIVKEEAKNKFGVKYEYVYFEEAGDCSLYRNSGNSDEYFSSKQEAMLEGRAAMKSDSAVGYTVYPESLRTRKIYIDE